MIIGCSDWSLDPRDDTAAPLVVVTDTFVQSARPMVDLLFVVDDTASMAQEHQALADGFSQVVASLDGAGVSWQVGVVSTDMSGDEAGWLLGQPWVISPSLTDPADAFAAAVDVGTDGSGPEAGLAAATRALALAAPGEVNSGFRRDGAGLHVLFVSDDDDSSDAWLDDPVDDFLAVLDGEVTSAGTVARASAIVGDSPDGCTSADGAAQAGTRYLEVVSTTEGVAGSICEPDLSEVLASLGEAALTYEQTFALRAEPVDGEVTVDVDGLRQTTGWTLTDDHEVRFEVPPVADAVIDVTYITEVTQ